MLALGGGLRHDLDQETGKIRNTHGALCSCDAFGRGWHSRSGRVERRAWQPDRIPCGSGYGAVCGGVYSQLTGRDVGGFAQIPAAPKHLLLAGFLVAFYILSITFIAPHFGVGNAVFFVLVGQLFSAAAIDHFGLFGAQVAPLGAARAAGIALMCAGVWLTQQA